MIFLINPSNKNFLYGSGDRPPLGLLYLSSALKQNNITHRVYDLNHEEIIPMLADMVKEKTTHVGISVFTTPIVNESKRLIENIREFSDSKIVVGGYHITARPRDLENIVDYSIVGYGENGLIKYIKEDSGKFFVEMNFDINKYPIPNRDALNMNNYNMKIEGLRTTLMTTSRGCPFTCSFCGNFDRNIKFRNEDNIDEEINQIKNKYKYEMIYFTDDSFTLNMKHAEKVGKLAKKYNLKYRIATRANLLNEDKVKMLKDTGCIYVGLGIESGNNEILNKSNKGMTVQDNEKAVKLLNKYDINSKGFFIIGLPGETHQTAQQTIKFAKYLKGIGLKYSDFYALTPYPGSDLYSNPEKYGIEILSNDYSKFIQAGKDIPDPIIKTKELMPNDIKKYINIAYKVWNG